MLITKKIDELLDLLNEPDYPFDQPNAMDNYMKYGFIRKDITTNESLKIISIKGCDAKKEKFYVLCDNYLEIPLYLKKERKFFELNNIKFVTIEELADWLNTEEANDWFIENNISLIATSDNDIVNGSLTKSYLYNKQNEFFNEIRNSSKTYKAKIIDKNNGGFIADVDGVQTFLPGSLASANKIINFNNFIGKTIDVMIEDFLKEDNTFIVSNKKYISHIMEYMISNLEVGKKYTGNVTGTSKFGIFIEWDEIFTGLLHISEMSEERKLEFNSKKYAPGSEIDFYIKEITSDNKIILTDFEKPEIVFTIEDFKQKFEKTIQEGEIISISQYGSFIKFVHDNNSFIGLLYYKDYSEDFVPKVKDKINLYISFVDTNNNKIFLKLK